MAWSKEKKREYSREYSKRNRPVFVKQTEEEKKEKRKVYWAEYYSNHKQKILKKNRKWPRDNRERSNFLSRQRYIPQIRKPRTEEQKEQSRINLKILNHQFYLKNKNQQYPSRSEAYRGKNKDKAIQSMAKYRKNNPEKVICRSIYAGAIRAGRLQRQPCEVCKTTKNIHGHHGDYTKPMQVNWLCAKHHMERHREVQENHVIVNL